MLLNIYQKFDWQPNLRIDINFDTVMKKKIKNLTLAHFKIQN